MAGEALMHRLRRRRRVARVVATAHGVSNAVVREWRWALRDLRDLKADAMRYRVRIVERIRNPEPFIRDDELRAANDELCRQLAALDRRIAARGK